ncbi:MAG: DUF2764 family protein [Kiritimatiellae bacterium]|jgi:hypothetical protein|nr:DUF2764 family protein [Kiritimatiellia bacterium]
MRTYVLASFPSLSFEGSCPFPYEKLFIDCAAHLSASDLEELDAVCATPPAGKSSFAKAWALARRQADVHNIHERLQRHPDDTLSLEKTESLQGPFDQLRSDIQTAWEASNPLLRETALLRALWNWIEDRRRTAPYSLDDLIGYALQLRLLERKDSWSESEGKTQFEQHISTFLEPVVEEVRKQELSV